MLGKIIPHKHSPRNKEAFRSITLTLAMICRHSFRELSYWPLLFFIMGPLWLAGAGRSVFSITDGCADS